MGVSSTQGKVILKFFLGFAITSECRMHLNRSISWKHLQIQMGKTDDALKEVHFHQKEYLGRHLEGENFPLSALKSETLRMQRELKEHFPGFEIDKLPVCIFPQLFVA